MASKNTLNTVLVSSKELGHDFEATGLRFKDIQDEVKAGGNPAEARAEKQDLLDELASKTHLVAAQVKQSAKHELLNRLEVEVVESPAAKVTPRQKNN